MDLGHLSYTLFNKNKPHLYILHTMLHDVMVLCNKKGPCHAVQLGACALLWFCSQDGFYVQ